MGPITAPWTLLSGVIPLWWRCLLRDHAVVIKKLIVATEPVLATTKNYCYIILATINITVWYCHLSVSLSPEKVIDLAGGLVRAFCEYAKKMWINIWPTAEKSNVWMCMPIHMFTNWYIGVSLCMSIYGIGIMVLSKLTNAVIKVQPLLAWMPCLYNIHMITIFYWNVCGPNIVNFLQIGRSR